MAKKIAIKNGWDKQDDYEIKHALSMKLNTKGNELFIKKKKFQIDQKQSKCNN